MITRRQLAGLGLAAAAAPGFVAAVAPGEPIQLTAKRAKITLPDLPALGLTYIALLDLFNPEGAPAGKAAAGASIVDLTLQGPVVLAHVVLKLSDGEIHYQRLMDRFGAFPRTAKGRSWAAPRRTATYAVMSISRGRTPIRSRWW